ncbi:MAG: hypothetical protein AAF662_07965 [Pseudomonadota bacterium]
MPDNDKTDRITSQSEEPQAKNDEPISFREISPAIEFVCWVVLALTPMLYLVNGPPVTDDQAAVQIGLVSLALSGAVLLRLYNWRIKIPDERGD